MSISAKVICDSISPQGVRLTTLELCYHRFIHSEVMTHRMFSRNASSSRAIPIERVLEQVKNSPAMPIHWGKNQPGMQAREEHSNIKACEAAWKYTSGLAIEAAQALADEGLHKQIVNRLLEPFQWIKVIVTATEWDNFFVLRLPYEELNSRQRAIVGKWKERFKNNPDGKDAQPEIQELARCMKKVMDNSTPLFLSVGEWHLPYVNEDEIIRGNGGQLKLQPELIKCSVARCARVSYLNHDNSNPDIEKDVALADKLLEAGHMSPFEHIATPMVTNKPCSMLELCVWEKGITHIDRDDNYWSSNFKGFLQYRNTL